MLMAYEFPPEFFMVLQPDGTYKKPPVVSMVTEDIDYKIAHNCVGDGSTSIAPPDPLSMSLTFSELSRADLTCISDSLKQLK